MSSAANVPLICANNLYGWHWGYLRILSLAKKHLPGTPASVQPCPFINAPSLRSFDVLPFPLKNANMQTLEVHQSTSPWDHRLSKLELTTPKHHVTMSMPKLPWQPSCIFPNPALSACSGPRVVWLFHRPWLLSPVNVRRSEWKNKAVIHLDTVAWMLECILGAFEHVWTQIMFSRLPVVLNL